MSTRKSKVWSKFTRISAAEGANSNKAIKLCQCNICHKVVKVNWSSTSHLWRHLRSHHLDIFNHSNTERDENPALKYSAIPHAVETLPCSSCESTDFRNTVVTADISVAASRSRARKKSLLANTQVSIAFDHWTSKSGDEYVAHVATYIKDWKLHSIVLGCSAITSKTAENILHHLRTVQADYGIDSANVTCVVTDTTSNLNLAATTRDGHWQGCACHLLELSVKRFWESKSIASIVSEVKEAALFLRNSTYKSLSDAISPYVAILDCATKWRSTYNMVDGMLKLKEAALLLIEAEAPALHHLPWATLELIVEALHVYEMWQRVLEGTDYVTISLVRIAIMGIKDYMRSCLQQERFSPIYNALQSMLSDFDDRWDPEMNPRQRRSGSQLLVLLAPLLDPRTKYSMPENDNLWEELIVLLEHMDSNESIGNGEESSEQLFMVPGFPFLFRHVHEHHSQEQQQQQQPKQPHHHQQHRAHIRPEVELYKKYGNLHFKYYNDNRIDWHSADPLKWWSQHASLFPNVAQLARKVLAIPASSAAAERVFSFVGKTITESRSTLTTEQVSELVDVTFSA